MSRSIRRVRRNLPAFDDPYYDINPEYDGFPRRAIRQYRPAPEIFNPTLAQRVASLEADVSDIAADLLNTDQRLAQLERGMLPPPPFGGYPPYGGCPPYGSPYGMPCGLPPCPPPCPPCVGGGCGGGNCGMGGGCGYPPPPHKKHRKRHDDSDDEDCGCQKKR